MKIVRSIAAVVVGFVVGAILISIIESVNALIYPPPNGMSGADFYEEMNKGTQVAKDWLREIPTSVMAILQVGWAVGALVGGAVSALIAGRARLIHAGIIGALVLAATIYNFYCMKVQLDYSHPDWLLVTGLLLPVPLSLLGGQLVSMLFDRAVPPPGPQETASNLGQ